MLNKIRASYFSLREHAVFQKICSIVAAAADLTLRLLQKLLACDATVSLSGKFLCIAEVAGLRRFCLLQWKDSMY